MIVAIDITIDRCCVKNLNRLYGDESLSSCLIIIGNGSINNETFEKCSFLPAQLNPYLIFNRGSRPRKVKILTTPVRSAGPTGQAGIH
jgi:hypothetical protein